MTRARVVRCAVALILGAVLALVGAPHQPKATASSPHRAAVVVDLGNGQVKVGCVSFTEDHLSGLEALDRASMAPVAETFGGQGSAVCALCGKGCTAGSTCLTCQAPNYWAYYHDARYSPTGASRSVVRNGDTEGWKWGKGEAPAKVPFDQVCPVSAGPPPTPSPSSTPVPPTGSPTTMHAQPPVTGDGAGPLTTPPAVPGTTIGPGPTSTGRGLPTSTTPRPTGSASTASTTSLPASTTTREATTPSRSGATPKGSGGKNVATGTVPRRVHVERVTASERAVAARAGTGHHGSLVSVMAFGLVIAAVAGLIVLLRRRRAGLG